MFQHLNFGKWLTLFLLCTVGGKFLSASTIRVAGVINQSTQDGTGPAVNNSTLNEIMDGNTFSIILDFQGFTSQPGTYELVDPVLTFTVPDAGSVESDFNLVVLTVMSSNGFDQLSLLACLNTGSGCDQGNELDLNFDIPSNLLNGVNVAAQATPGLLPLDLLEDDGVTDIQGSVTTFSNPAGTDSPEPSAFLLFCAGVLTLGLGRFCPRTATAPFQRSARSSQAHLAPAFKMMNPRTIERQPANTLTKEYSIRYPIVSAGKST
jgi:hypothetical protein